MRWDLQIYLTNGQQVRALNLSWTDLLHTLEIWTLGQDKERVTSFRVRRRKDDND